MVKNNRSLSDSSSKIGRNEQCPCGSGKKYKKCCLVKAIMKERAIAIAQEQTKLVTHVHTEGCRHDNGSSPDSAPASV